MERFKERELPIETSEKSRDNVLDMAIKNFPSLEGRTFAEKLNHLESLLFEAGLELDPVEKKAIKKLLRDHLLFGE